ncbi:MAG: hypothetical protein MHM6MM_004006 [Cercozoa sp. M6MM]
MGAVVKRSVSPKKFLKKKSGTLASSGRDVSPQKSKRQYKKPPLPKPSETPVYGLTTEKNFIKANAIANILKEPNRPKSPPPDELLKHEEFARVPAYLDEVKKV